MHFLVVMSHEDDGFLEDGAFAKIVFAEREYGRNIRELLNKIYRIARDDLSTSQIVIIREPLRIGMGNSELTSEDFERVPNAQVHFMYVENMQLHLSENKNANIPNPVQINEQKLFEAIKNREMNHFLSGYGVINDAGKSFRFLGPSGREARKFLRIGNMQRHRYVPDAIASWLLESMRDSCAIMADSWTIGATAFNLSRRLRELRDDRESVPVEFLSHYPNKDEIESEIEDILSRLRVFCVKESSEILVVISIHQTGGLMRRILDAASSLGMQKQLRIVALFASKDCKDEVDALHYFPNDVVSGSDFGLVTQQEEVDTISIDPELYYPHKMTDYPINIREKHGNNSKKFSEIYREYEIFRLHEDGMRDNALDHQIVWIDSEKLTLSDEFERRIFEKFRELDIEPSLVVAPPHEAGRNMMKIWDKFASPEAQLARTILHSDLILDDELPEDKEIGNYISSLNADTSILILDDCFRTGSRLVNFQRSLRILGYEGQIQYIVGVAQPRFQSKWSWQARMLRYRGKDDRTLFPTNYVDAVEILPLPHLGEDVCPWCLEKERLQRLVKNANAMEVSDLLKTRIEELKGRRSVEWSALVSGSDKEAGLQFSDGSILVSNGVSPSMVVACVASALQSVREEVQARGGSTIEIRGNTKISFDPDDYFRIFSDVLISSAIIRMADSRELRLLETERISHQRELFLEKWNSSNEVDNDRKGELILAILSGKFPENILSGNDYLDVSDFVAATLKVLNLQP